MKNRLLLFFILGGLFTATAQTDSSKRSKGEAMMIAYQLYERITKNNENFAEVAKAHSEDPGSAPMGGLYENVNKGTFVKKFDEVVFKLKPNEVSRPFRTSFGYHIVQLISTKGETFTCRHILIAYEGSGW